MWWEGLRIIVAPESNDRRMWTSEGIYVAETRFTGAHVGPFLGLAPTGRRIEFRFAVFVPFRDGLMAGERFYYDLDGLLRQLGAGRPAITA
jgi:predicted ester cyclase